MISRGAEHLRARMLYRVGWSPKRIAEVLGVSKSSVLRWKKRDLEENDVDWEARREKYAEKGPDACLQAIRERKLDLLRDREADLEAVRDELEVLQEIEKDFLDEASGMRDAITSLSAARHMAKAQGASEEEMKTLEAMIGRFLLDRYRR